MVLIGYRLYGRLPPATLFVCSGLAAAGLLASAYASSLIQLYLFYGLIFGAANGLGYGYALQLAGQALPDKRGMAMSLVTAFYAVGATGAPPLFVFYSNKQTSMQHCRALHLLSSWFHWLQR